MKCHVAVYIVIISYVEYRWLGWRSLSRHCFTELSQLAKDISRHIHVSQSRENAHLGPAHYRCRVLVMKTWTYRVIKICLGVDQFGGPSNVFWHFLTWNAWALHTEEKRKHTWPLPVPVQAKPFDDMEDIRLRCSWLSTQTDIWKCWKKECQRKYRGVLL